MLLIFLVAFTEAYFDASLSFCVHDPTKQFILPVSSSVSAIPTTNIDKAAFQEGRYSILNSPQSAFGVRITDYETSRTTELNM